jgi:shikimate dehydrogenase
VAAINGSTELYGIIGRPVVHSLSPAMHNAAFAALELNKVYLPFEVADVPGAMVGLRALGIRGASVTIPHKQAVIPHLDEVEPVAARIGAVNTLVLEHGRLKGYNTDWLGANRALTEKIELAGRKVLLLGAGGSARAIGFGLREAGADLLLASRTPEKGQALALELGCQWYPLAAADSLAATALVNATSVGMAPQSEQSPMPRHALAGFEVVMDIVYAPLATKLLREAAAAGCQVVDGLAMLLYQGAAQFELWTGRPAPLEVMRAVLVAAVRK